MPRAVSKLGVAFVAWTRATTWSKVAFQSLPALEEFLAVRMSKEFQVRETFEMEADALHDAFLRRRGVTEEAQLQGHRAHLQAYLLRALHAFSNNKNISNNYEMAFPCFGRKKETCILNKDQVHLCLWYSHVLGVLRGVIPSQLHRQLLLYLEILSFEASK